MKDKQADKIIKMINAHHNKHGKTAIDEEAFTKSVTHPGSDLF